MSRLTSDAEYLAWRVAETVRRPPLGVRPWHGERIVRILTHAATRAEDHGAFHLTFMDGIRDLLDEREDAIFHRFVTHALLSEARINADENEQRDHLTHVSQVFLLGWLILNGTRTFAIGPAEWKPYGWQTDPEERTDRLNRGWLYASLLHDCGYSMELTPRAILHELRIAALYGDFFEVGNAGDADDGKLREAGEKVWKWRKRHVVPDATRADLEDTLTGQVPRRDHALLTGAALMRHAEQLRGQVGSPPGLPDVLDAASAAIASHNFQYLVGKVPHRAWFHLDFYEEPLAALLHLADELQEWSRERVDEALLRLLPTRKLRYATTEITRLELNDAAGLSVDVGLLRRLYPDDRRRKARIVWSQEQSIADTAARLRLLFEPRGAPAEFRLHLRARQAVDDRACSTELTVDWPTSSQGPVGIVPEKRSIPSPLQEARVSVGESVALRLRESGAVDVAMEPGFLVIVSEGGAGKSTLLNALALSKHDRAHYVEELPGYAADLGEELRSRNLGSEPILIVDHLDRLEDAPHGAFWLAEMKRLARERPELRIVCACRRDAYERFVEASLGGGSTEGRVRRGEIEGPGLGLAVDSERRVRAFGIEREIVDCTYDERVALGRLALSWGTSRRGDAYSDGAWPGKFGRERRRVLVKTRDGGARFVHDIVQDFLAAYAVAADLAENQADPEFVRRTVRQLIGAPREVPRLLFDLLSKESKALGRRRQTKASEALARAFLVDGNLRFWLWHKDRYTAMVPALDEFVRAHSTSTIVRASAHALLAHARHAIRTLPGTGARLGAKDREGYRVAIAHYASALEAIVAAADGDELPQRPGQAVDDATAQLAVFIADHALSNALARLRSVDPDFALEMAQQLKDALPIQRSAPTTSPAWLRRCLEMLIAADSPRGWIDVCSAMEGEVRDWAAEPDRPNLEIPLAHWAAHISGSYSYLLGFGEADNELARHAIQWNQRSRARFERVRRRIESGNVDPCTDSDATLPDVRANVAARESYQVMTHLRYWREGLTDERRRRLALDVLDAHKRQQSAWHIARAELAPGERLSQIYRNVLPHQKAGEVLEWAIQHKAPPSIGAIEKELRHLASKALDGLPAEGEESPRFSGEDSSKFYEELGGSGRVVACVRDLAAAVRGWPDD